MTFDVPKKVSNPEPKHLCICCKKKEGKLRELHLVLCSDCFYYDVHEFAKKFQIEARREEREKYAVWLADLIIKGVLKFDVKKSKELNIPDNEILSMLGKKELSKE